MEYGKIEEACVSRGFVGDGKSGEGGGWEVVFSSGIFGIRNAAIWAVVVCSETKIHQLASEVSCK